jgi:hypothetical protein
MSSSIDAPTALVHAGSYSSSEELEHHQQTLNLPSHQHGSIARRLRRMKRRLLLDYASQEVLPHHQSSLSASSSLSFFYQENAHGSNDGSSISGERSFSDFSVSSSPSLDDDHYHGTIIEEVSAARKLRRLKRKLLLEYASQPILSQH